MNSKFRFEKKRLVFDCLLFKNIRNTHHLSVAGWETHRLWKMRKAFWHNFNRLRAQIPLRRNPLPSSGIPSELGRRILKSSCKHFGSGDFPLLWYGDCSHNLDVLNNCSCLVYYWELLLLTSKRKCKSKPIRSHKCRKILCRCGASNGNASILLPTGKSNRVHCPLLLVTVTSLFNVINTRMPFSRRPTSRLPIEIQDLQFDLGIPLTLVWTWPYLRPWPQTS